jgi:hypothetical protein
MISAIEGKLIIRVHVIKDRWFEILLQETAKEE